MFQRLRGSGDAIFDAHRGSTSRFRSESCGSISSMGTVRRHRMVTFYYPPHILRRSSTFFARTGPTTCVAGFDCVFSNPCKSQEIVPGYMVETHRCAPPDHSQCLPAAPQPAPGTQIRAAEDPVFHFYLQNIGMHLLPSARCSDTII